MSTDSDWVLFHIGLKWSPKTTEEIARELNAIGISVDLDTVCRILKKGGWEEVELWKVELVMRKVAKKV